MAFRWDKRRERAAQLVADNDLTDERIADEVGVSRAALSKWKLESEFRDRVAGIVTTYREALERDGLGNRQFRLDRLNERHQALRQIVRERGADPDLADIPGGTTGHVVRRWKMIGAGESAVMVSEYEVDTGTLSEFRQMEKQAAQETGQWADKHEHSGEVIVRRYIGVDFDAI